MKKNKTVMVTGAAGFIGSHLSEALVSKGYIVHAFDLYPIDACDNLKELSDNPNFLYSNGDIRNNSDIESFFQTDADCIFHLASIVGVNLYMEDPLSLIDIGVIGTRNLIELAIKNDVKMIFTSTSEVYGKNKKIPWSESDDRVLGSTNVDRWCYSSSKALIEHILFATYRKFDWPMSISQIF